jgi:hypothetical protein
VVGLGNIHNSYDVVRFGGTQMKTPFEIIIIPYIIGFFWLFIFEPHMWSFLLGCFGILFLLPLWSWVER